MKMKFITDEDFNNRILRGVLRRHSSLDFVRVQDVGLSGAEDSNILIWASQSERILLTHDRKTMPKHIAEVIASGHDVAGIIVVPQSMSIGEAIKNILFLAEHYSAEEIKNQTIIYLPR